MCAGRVSGAEAMAGDGRVPNPARPSPARTDYFGQLGLPEEVEKVEDFTLHPFFATKAKALTG